VKDRARKRSVGAMLHFHRFVDAAGREGTGSLMRPSCGVGAGRHVGS
jgi:hypothetical protein